MGLSSAESKSLDNESVLIDEAMCGQSTRSNDEREGDVANVKRRGVFADVLFVVVAGVHVWS